MVTAKQQRAVVRVLSENTSRTATLMGRAFRVIPAVLVRSQVLRNNLGVAFLPADEITDDWAELWNGIPVLVGDHPRQHGQSVSARTPELWDARAAGWVFDAQAEQESANVRRLVAEVWLDESRAAVVPGLRAILDRVRAGQAVELSTGFVTRVESRGGEFQGESFEMVMRPANPDHLVISTEMTGACSVEDGCGLGANCLCGGKCRKGHEVDQTSVSQVAAELAKPENRNVAALVNERTGAAHVFAAPVPYWKTPKER